MKLHGLISGFGARGLGMVSLLAVLAWAPSATAQGGGVLLPDGIATDGPVYTVATGDDGSTYLGGSFTLVGPWTGSAVMTPMSGNGDPTILPQVVGGNVLAAAPDGAGGWYIGGNFISVAGVPRNKIAHILSDGTVDPTWNPDANSTVYAIAVSGTDVFFGGSFTMVNGTTTRNRIAKTMTTGNGTVDPTWNPDANDSVLAIAVSGTDVFFGGSFTTVNGATTRNRIAKTPTTGNGTVDPTWNPNASSEVRAIAVSGTDVFFGGDFTTVNGATARNHIAKTPTTGDGTVDPTWNPNANGYVSAIAVPGTELFFGGSFTTVNGATTRNRIAKTPTTGNGTVDPTWNPNANAVVYSIAVSGTNVFFGGFFTSVNGATPRNRIAETPTTGNGTVDPTWNPNANGYVSAIAVSGTDVLFGGSFVLAGSQVLVRNRIAKLLPDGAVDPTWNPNASDVVYAIAVSGTGVFFGGDFTTVNGATTRNRIAKTPTTGDGSVDPTWNPDANSTVFSIAVFGTTVFFGGDFTTVNGATTRIRIAKTPTTGDGTVDPTWNPNANNTVYAIAVSGTEVFFGGLFTMVNGATTRNRIAKTPTTGNGTVDPTWNPNASSEVRAIVVSGTDVFFGGSFITVNGATTRNRIAKTLTTGNGTVDPTWNPNANRAVAAIAVSGTDVFFGGDFTTVNGATTRNHIAKTQTTGDGTVDPTWNPNPNSWVLAIAPYGWVLSVGGMFTTLDGRGSNCFGRLLASVATLLRVVAEPPGVNCPAGGQKLEFSAPLPAVYVCNGEEGADGASANVTVTTEAPGTNCAYGGLRIDTSVGSGPVVTAYVCNGVEGAVVVIVAEGPGPNCAHGGIKITSAGRDQYVCNGSTSLVSVEAEEPGANCEEGGIRISNGVDQDGDGVLSLGEVDSTSYVCNGLSGEDGADKGGGCSAAGSQSDGLGLGLVIGLPLVLMLLGLRRRRRSPRRRGGARRPR